MNFPATLKREVGNRGAAPDAWLDTLITWARYESDEVFARNGIKREIYTAVFNQLGPWNPDEPDFILHRKAVMCEVMRIHAGYESSWNWKEDVDRSNATSVRDSRGAEAGAFQVSWDSLRLAPSLGLWLGSQIGISDEFAPAKDQFAVTVESFRHAMMHQPAIACGYYARLGRIVEPHRWAGPFRRGEVQRLARMDAVADFRRLLG